MSKPLSERQRRFVDAYLADAKGNATTSAIAAGYSRKNARRLATRLLSKAYIQAAIAAGQAARSERTEITQDRVLQELGLLAFSSIDHYTVDDHGEVELTDGAPAGAMRALSSIKRRITRRGTGKNREVTCEVELKLWDKPGPLKLAGLHVGLKFVEKHEHTGKDGKPIETRVTFGGRYRKT